MKIFFCGDVVGRSGREALETHLPDIKKEYSPDFIIVNVENAAHGFGITPKLCEEFYRLGIDVLTTGNHIWDQKEIIGYIDKDPRLIRPINYPPGTPGRGLTIIPSQRGQKVAVINVMGRLFMDALDDPFQAIQNVLKTYPLGGRVHALIIDIHAEANSEKNAMGVFCDGLATAVIGTHTHIPTADARILPKGTAFQTDAGMCGDYQSIIGMKPEVPLYKFLHRRSPKDRMEPASGTGTLCGLLIETHPQTGLAEKVTPIQRGGVLKTLP